MDNPFQSYTPYVGQGTPGSMQPETFNPLLARPTQAGPSIDSFNAPSATRPTGSEFQAFPGGYGNNGSYGTNASSVGYGSNGGDVRFVPSTPGRTSTPTSPYGPQGSVGPYGNLQQIPPSQTDISQLYPQNPVETQSAYQAEVERCRMEGNCNDLYRMMNEGSPAEGSHKALEHEEKPKGDCHGGFLNLLPIILFAVFSISMLIISMAYNKLGPVVNIVSNLFMFAYIFVIIIVLRMLISRGRCYTAWIVTAVALTLQVLWMLFVVVWA